MHSKGTFIKVICLLLSLIGVLVANAQNTHEDKNSPTLTIPDSFNLSDQLPDLDSLEELKVLRFSKPNMPNYRPDSVMQYYIRHKKPSPNIQFYLRNSEPLDPRQ